MYNASTQNHVKTLRKSGELKYDIITVVIPWWVMSNRINYLETKVKQHLGYHGNIVHLLMYHYHDHDFLYWQDFLNEWINKCSHYSFVVATDQRIVCALSMHYLVYKGTYIRILCSKMSCGGILLQHILEKYNNNRFIALNSEMSALGFYEKYGFLRRYDIPLEEGKYPYMIYGTHPDYQAVIGAAVTFILSTLFIFALSW
jgi:hypothetical protein